jgi:hypothetical protein
VCPMVPVSQHCPLLITPLVFSTFIMNGRLSTIAMQNKVWKFDFH